MIIALIASLKSVCGFDISYWKMKYAWEQFLYSTLIDSSVLSSFSVITAIMVLCSLCVSQACSIAWCEFLVPVFSARSVAIALISVVVSGVVMSLILFLTVISMCS